MAKAAATLPPIDTKGEMQIAGTLLKRFRKAITESKLNPEWQHYIATSLAASFELPEGAGTETMKVKARQPPAKYKAMAVGAMIHKFWKRHFPFNVNPRGILIHRVKWGQSMFWNKKWSHDGVRYWCDGQTNGEGVSLTDRPPKDRILCQRCEALAVAAGEPTADKLAGRHVHVGLLRAYRTCCRSDNN